MFEIIFKSLKFEGIRIKLYQSVISPLRGFVWNAGRSVTVVFNLSFFRVVPHRGVFSKYV